jgi:adenylate cyclase
MLQSFGLPLKTMQLFVRTLNPQLYGLFFKWDCVSNQVEATEATHTCVASDAYLNSPYAPIINGEGGVRGWLDVDETQLDYPILDELLNQGATDCVALPLRFSDNQINILSLVSDEPGGFSTNHLGYLYEILPLLGRLIEAHAQRASSLMLLQTYLGRSTGERVLNGSVKLGDGEDLDTIIWFSDLRNSTGLADTMTRESYLAALDQYFDCVAGAVMEQGGEVLKFIGDAVLAIFPIGERDGLSKACNQAHSALRQAFQHMEHANKVRIANGEQALAFGTGLHRGNITYGNIGTSKRLDFTVIGPAVNEASRIESLCKTLEEAVLASAAFASGLASGLTSLGEYELQGVKARQEIFKLEVNPKED